MMKKMLWISWISVILLYACSNSPANTTETVSSSETELRPFFSNGFHCTVTPFPEKLIGVPITGSPPIPYKILLAIDVSNSTEPFYEERNEQVKAILETVYSFVMATGKTVHLSIVTFSTGVNDDLLFADIHWSRQTSEQRIQINGPDIENLLQAVDNLTYEPGRGTYFTNLISFAIDTFFSSGLSETRNIVISVGDSSFDTFHPATYENQEHIKEVRAIWADEEDKRNGIEYFFLSLGSFASEDIVEWKEYFFREDTTTSKPRGDAIAIARPDSTLEIRNILLEDWPNVKLNEDTIFIPQNLVSLDIVFFFPNGDERELTISGNTKTLAEISEERDIPLDLLADLNSAYSTDQQLQIGTRILLPNVVIKTNRSGSVARFEYGGTYYQVWNITSPDLLTSVEVTGIPNKDITYQLVGYPPVYDVRTKFNLLAQGGSTLIQAVLQGVTETDSITLNINGEEHGEMSIFHDEERSWFTSEIFFPVGKFGPGEVNVRLSARRGDSLLFTASCLLAIIPTATVTTSSAVETADLIPGNPFNYRIEIFRPVGVEIEDLTLHLSSSNALEPVVVPIQGSGEFLTAETTLKCPLGTGKLEIVSTLQQIHTKSVDRDRTDISNSLATLIERHNDDLYCSCSNNVNFAPFYDVAPWTAVILLGLFLFKKHSLVIYSLITLACIGIAFIIASNPNLGVPFSVALGLLAIFIPSVGLASNLAKKSDDNFKTAIVGTIILLVINYFIWNYAVNHCALI